MEQKRNISNIKNWLKNVLIEENLIDFSVELTGNSSKGDGYMGDIIFVHVSGKMEDNTLKEYNLVLKCGKTSQTLRDSIPVKETFENEIYVYDKIFPAFVQFQREKGLEKIFDSVPKSYGSYISDDMEVIFLENLKSLGYRLYDRKKPQTLEHIHLVISEYGKFHAISAAMQQQYPEKFKRLVMGIKDIWKRFNEATVLKIYTSAADDLYELIKEDVNENVAERLKKFKNQISYILDELPYKKNYFSVITHGDNWNNNFMFKYEEGNERVSRVAMLDWQISRFCSPITDLSYFLYTCISKEDLEKFDDILKIYHDSFSNYLRKLGSDPDKLFPYSQLMSDWKIFSKFGIMMSFLIVKIAISDQDEVGDMAETLESGLDLSDTFLYDIKNKHILKDRLLCVVEHVVERDFI